MLPQTGDEGWKLFHEEVAKQAKEFLKDGKDEKAAKPNDRTFTSTGKK